MSELQQQRTYDDSMFRDTFEHEYTWTNGFLRNVVRYADKTALIDPDTDRKWTYSQLNAEVNRLSSKLKKCGIGHGDVVMCALRNCPEFAFSYIAPRKIGGIFLAANYNLSASEMALLIDANEPKVVIYSACVVSVMKEAAELCNFKPSYFVLADNIECAETPLHHVAYEDFVCGEDESEPVIDFRRHIYDEAVRLCTSGTTAVQKNVPINEINEVLTAHDVIMHYPMNCNDVTMNMTPWFHRGGCHSGGICPSFYIGAAVVVMRIFKPHAALEWVSRYGITFLMGAPANLEMLCRAQTGQKSDLSALRGIVTMGAPLLKDNCIRFMQVLTPNIFNGYGTTETFWNSFLKPEHLPENAGSVGLSCTDDEVRVIKMSDDRRIEPDD
ncbi:MAG: AMP-binding protein, partial [Treponema sp.]|nr:AMP-binding protein [Treponema sp.]